MRKEAEARIDSDDDICSIDSREMDSDSNSSELMEIEITHTLGNEEEFVE